MLENPVWAALSGPQACFAEASGDAARFHSDVGPWCAVADPRDPAAWADLAELTSYAALTGPSLRPAPGWETVAVTPGVQMVGHTMTGVSDPETVRLGETDVPEMLDLVHRAQLGPFGKRTVELGNYLGIRHEGRLVAMAGERFRLPGWTEVSAVCTDPEFRGQGLAARLTMAVANAILARGDLPFLHVNAENAAAIRLYERLGFQVDHEVVFAAYRRA
ncbi:GNAT family N-acetyltransferase [Actinoplanes sp. URMC 104]|uniref:GNAT family N-acetyltransferase n=1 Tax=Actinoplanes sp. URMC 104 TaxID=3423409 RepID=UPI003F1A5EDC